MKKIMLFLLTGLITISLWGQEKKDLTLSVAKGKLNSPYYQKDRAGDFYSIDFDYYITSRQMVSANFTAGGHRYYEDILSNNPNGTLYEDGTNAKIKYQIFSILYKFKIVNKKAFSMALGTGAGFMTDTQEYPYMERNFFYPRQSTGSDLVFPVRLEMDYKFSKHMRIGFIGGFYIHPDYPILAYHAGPRLTYVAK